MSKPNDPGKRALGRGLAALLPSRPPGPEAAAAPPAAEPDNSLKQIPIDQIEPNPLQPRTVFQPEKLQELAGSIQVSGIIQPLIVQRKGERFQLIAGERRWRAAQLAGLTEVPVVVREMADQHLLELALVENIQREDLNPIETAQALERLGRELSLSHEEIGRRTGKERATITNLLRLLKLPSAVQLLVAEQRLSMGHARAILGLPTAELQQQVAERVVAEGLSVRQVEKLVQIMSRPAEPAAPAEEKTLDPNIRAAMQEMEHSLGTRVRIVEKNNETGKIEIEYYSQDDLDRIYRLIIRETNA